MASSTTSKRGKATFQPSMLFVPSSSLLFDDSNPRFGALVSGKSQPEIQRLLIDEPHYASQLVDSLIENGFIEYEPLIVKRHGDDYIVIEGNRRLAAIQEIRKNLAAYGKGEDFLKDVPVLVFPESSESDNSAKMRIYLGVRHLLGYREWSPFSKAQFLDNASSNPGGLDTVLKEVRLTKQAARRFLVPFRLLRSSGMKLGEEDFWMLAEALQRQGVKKFIQLEVDPKNLVIAGYEKKNFSLLMDDLYGPKENAKKIRSASKRVISDTRMLSTYSAVLLSEKATKILQKTRNLEEAAIYVDTQEESLARLQNASKKIGVLIKKVSPAAKTPEARALHEAYKQFDSVVKDFVKTHA